MSLSTLTTLVSGAYTLYKIHPYIPYRFLWKYMAVPALEYLHHRAPEEHLDLECYEIIEESRDSYTGVVTRYLVLKNRDDSFTVVDKEPEWL